MKSPCAASGDQTRPDPSGDDASAACGAARGTGSNSENSIRPARNPPICACQATLAPSAPIAIDPTPKMMLTPNQTARNPSTRPLRNASRQRQRRNLRRGIGIAAAERQKAALHEGKANGGRHGAGHRRRGADHRRDRMLMGEQMRQRAGRRRHRHEQEEPDRAEPARQRAAERQQPQHVEADMAEIGVQQRIGDEGPDLGAGAAGKGDVEQRRIVALRNEAEDVDGPVFEFRRQQHPQMNDRDQRDIGRQRARQRQDRLARGVRRQFLAGIRVRDSKGSEDLRRRRLCRTIGPDRRLCPHCASAQIGKEKGRALRKPSLVCRSFRAPRNGDHIPTPPRAMTKLFDATCVPTAPVTWR